MPQKRLTSPVVRPAPNTHLTNTDAAEEVDKPGGETSSKHGVAGVPVPGHHIRSTGHQFRGKVLQTKNLFTVLGTATVKSKNF
jgi:hypothetical protein